MNTDPYYNRNEVSNSDLTELKNILYPHIQYGDKEAAFKFGTLFDAMVTENERVDYFKYMCDKETYTCEDFDLAIEMVKALRFEAKKDHFLEYVLKNSDTQRFMINKDQEFDYCGCKYKLNTRCKWDWWLNVSHFGGDLKSTAASTQKEFIEAIDFFDWDRSRAWYMDIAKSNRDFIYAVSKKNCKVFKFFIQRGDDTYKKGFEKYQDLAFRWWQLIE